MCCHWLEAINIVMNIGPRCPGQSGDGGVNSLGEIGQLCYYADHQADVGSLRCRSCAD